MKRGVLVLCALGAALYGCKQDAAPATGVVVALQSDLGAELASIDVTVYDAAEKTQGGTHHFVLGRGVKLPLSLGIAPSGDQGESFVVVAAGNDADGELLAEVKARGTFAPGKTLGPLWLYLSSICRPAGRCDKGQTCDPAGGTGECGPIPSPELGVLESGPLMGDLPDRDGGPPDDGGDAHAGGTGGSSEMTDGGGTAGTGGAGPDGGMDAGPDAEIDAGAPDSGPLTEDDSGTVAVGLIAEPGSECVGDDALACGGHNDVRKLTCAASEWTLIGTCDGETRCDPIAGTTLGTCQAIPDPCVGKDPGTEVCDGTERKRCDADLLRLEADDCPMYAHCDASGVVTCVCDPGFQDNGAGGCGSIDSCLGDPCGPGGTCIDTADSYSCTCASGYSGSGTQMCANIDDCVGNTCGVGGTCVDEVGGYHCTCMPGYSGTGTETCTNITDCTGNPCGTGGTCIDGVGTYTCNCASGYSGTGGQICTNINDCPGNTCGTGGTCVDGVGTYTCNCASGYSGSGTQMCTNVNDCSGNTCGTGGTCIDGVNNYSCSCASGYSGSGTKICTNIDDCPGNTCGVGGTCVDGVNTYSCTCMTGYSGGGTKVCTNINDCAGNPCGAGGTCVDGINSHSCMCSAGYTGTTVCSDVDECAQSNVCTTDFPCQNQTPFYRCRGQYAEQAPTDVPNTLTPNAANGTVTDSRTGLIWQRAVDAGSYNWAQAKSYCGALTLNSASWRLPSKAELESILDFSRTNPAINPTAFPNTPAGYFWTSSPFIGTAANAYIVHFDEGGGGNYSTANSINVRCVR